jgi:hypothetical protein
MKLCPQCEFLYEDDQIFCDMDGESLVHDSRAEVLSDAAPAVTGTSPKRSRLKLIVVTMIGGLLLLVLLSFAYYASTRSFKSDIASRDRKPETNSSQQTAAAPVDKSAAQPAASPFLSPPETASESPAVNSAELAEKSQSARTQTTSKAGKNTSNANDSRLTISKRVPPLPQLNPLPPLPPPRRLAPAKPSATLPATTLSGKQKHRQATTETSQKSVIVEVKPASRNATKGSKVSAFLKKTGRIITKPFKR